MLAAAKQAAGMELERIKGENRELLQKAALLDSLTAEADALRHQVCLLCDYPPRLRRMLHDRPFSLP